VLLVHTALSRLGFVPGAARTVIESLLGAVGQSGTIMMPTYSGELSDPAEWRHPPVPAHWVQPILDETPPYDPKLTPTRGMGVVAELFRHFPGVLRSPHPQSSFAARGPFAETLVREHPLDYRFGSRSPLGKLRDIGGKVLLLGAPPETCSLFYLTQEYMTKNVEVLRKAPLLRNDCKAWVQYRDIEYPCAWFGAACDYLCGLGIARRILIGNATSYIFPARVAVEALVTWRHGIGV
jgi:aminoglycoside 3-N-acetyltransferase